MAGQDPAFFNTTALAFLGDAVYETFIRAYALESGQVHADRLHRMAVKYVRAEGQAAALRQMMPELSQEELALVKRAKNKKITSKPRYVDPLTYKMATAFEALMGYLYLSRKEERLLELERKAISIIEESEEQKR